MRRWALACGLFVFGWATVGCQCPWQRQSIRAYVVHQAKPTFRQLLADFRKESGIRVDAGEPCRSAMADILKKSADGDICITSGRENIDQILKDGLSKGPAVDFAELIPVIVVPKGNPKKIASLGDLAKPGLRVTLEQKGSCMGQMTVALLEKNKLTEKIEPNVVARVSGHQKNVQGVDGEKVDATIAWLWAVREVNSPAIEVVAIPPELNYIEPFGALVLTTAKNPAAAQKLIAFLQSEKAKRVLAEAGLR